MTRFRLGWPVGSHAGSVEPRLQGRLAHVRAKEWEIATLQAAQAAKAAGKLPASLDRLAASIRHPSVDWRAALRRFVQTSACSDYRWFPPNRRFVSSGLYLPSLRSDELGSVVIAVDTSGSIGQDLLDSFAAEMTAILEDSRPEALHVVYCDRRITATETLTPDDLPLRLRARGGGGTDFRPPFEWVEEQSIALTCFIYLTDLICRNFPGPPGYPVIWAAMGKRAGPFGETLRLDTANAV